MKKKARDKKHCFSAQQSFIVQSMRYLLRQPGNEDGRDFVKRNVEKISSVVDGRKNKLVRKQHLQRAKQASNVTLSQDDRRVQKLRKGLNPLLFQDVA